MPLYPLAHTLLFITLFCDATNNHALKLFQSKHGPPMTWDNSTLFNYCLFEGFTAKFCGRIKSFNGAALCALDDQSRSKLSSDKRTQQKLSSLILACTNLNPNLSLTQFESGVGAEEFRLEALRQAARLDFHTMLWALSNCPHVALGSLRFFRPHFDSVLYGADEAEKKSPFSWLLFLLAPGTVAIRYFWAFFDTDPGEVNWRTHYSACRGGSMTQVSASNLAKCPMCIRISASICLQHSLFF